MVKIVKVKDTDLLHEIEDLIFNDLMQESFTAFHI
jgi:hypothetical protein